MQSLNYDNIWPIDKDDARVLFHKTKELFDRAGLKFSLTFGSLLGAVRDKGLIKGDEDVDIFVWDEEKLRNNLISFQKDGLKVCRICPGALYSFRVDPSCYIDVYILRELKGWKTFPWRLYCVSLCGNETPRKFFKEWSEIEFLGEKVLCPANPERLLEFWFGSDWRIPQNKKRNLPGEISTGLSSFPYAYTAYWKCLEIPRQQRIQTENLEAQKRNRQLLLLLSFYCGGHGKILR